MAKPPTKKENQPRTNARQNLSSRIDTSSTEKTNQNNPSSSNAYDTPKNFHQIPPRSSNASADSSKNNFFTLTNIASALTILGFLGAALWHFSKLDSKVDYLGTDLNKVSAKTDIIEKNVTENIQKTEIIQQDLTKNMQKVENIEQELSTKKSNQKK